MKDAVNAKAVMEQNESKDVEEEKTTKEKKDIEKVAKKETKE
jgi:hypothetical protein